MKFFLFLLCIAAVHAISQQQMNSTTGFSTLSCNVATNSYLFTIVNGYTVPNNLIVLLECTNVAANSVSYTVPAIGTVSGSISPITGTVQNHFCAISVYTPSEPFTNNTVVYQSVDSTCGGVTVPSSVQADCDYWNIPCQFDTGQWYYNLPCLLLLYLLMIIVVLVIVAVFVLILWSENNAINQARKDQVNGAKANPELMKSYLDHHRGQPTVYSSLRTGSNASMVFMKKEPHIFTRAFGGLWFGRKKSQNDDDEDDDFEEGVELENY